MPDIIFVSHSDPGLERRRADTHTENRRKEKADLKILIV